MLRHVVIARYSENIDWTHHLARSIRGVKLTEIFLYNKGKPLPKIDDLVTTIDLPNVGREGHTYLCHIINHWDNLPDHCVFLQAGWEIHQRDDKKAGEMILKAESAFHGLDGYWINSPLFSFWDMEPYHDEAVKMARSCFGMNYPGKLEEAYFLWGACFVASKERIRSVPLESWTRVRDILSRSIDPKEGYAMEKLWPFVLGEDVRSNVPGWSCPDS